MTYIDYSDFEEICAQRGYIAPPQSNLSHDKSHNDIPITLNMKCLYPGHS